MSKKTYTELVEEIDNLYEKGMSQSEVAELIDDAISVATKVKNDPKKSDKHKRTASSVIKKIRGIKKTCLLYTSPSPRDATLSRMPSSA